MTKSADPHNDYEFLDQIGIGSFGSVYRAIHRTIHHVVAIKVMRKKFKDTAECEALREIKLLRTLPPHPNIVQLYDSFFSHANDLYFVMEFVDCGNIYQLIKTQRDQNTLLTQQQVKYIVHQVISALEHVHKHNILHRDLKPENLLLGSSPAGLIVKLADFGLARESDSKPPYTDYISTRWYRAPEVLLRSTLYTSSIDMWAVGAIIAELITLQPLFPGQSEIDQLFCICRVIGTPVRKIFVRKRARPEQRVSPGFARKRSMVEEMDSPPKETSPPMQGREWKEGIRLAQKIGFEFPQIPGKPLEQILPNTCPSLIDLIQKCLVFMPEARITAQAALYHSCFDETPDSAMADEDKNLWTKSIGSMTKGVCSITEKPSVSTNNPLGIYEHTLPCIGLLATLETSLENQETQVSEKEENPDKTPMTSYHSSPTTPRVCSSLKRRDSHKEDTERHTHRRIGYYSRRHTPEPNDKTSSFPYDNASHFTSHAPSWLSNATPNATPGVFTLNDSFSESPTQPTHLYHPLYQNSNDTKHSILHPSSVLSVAADCLPTSKANPSAPFNFWPSNKSSEEERAKEEIATHTILDISHEVQDNTSGASHSEHDLGINKEWRWLQIL
ncbi:kinase-like domain-containing protein [Spinellus fusiger]|nr:kinase-like domain-containing protein [Spinellus fusiger]